MVKIIQPNIPAEWEELFAKIFRWFERNGVPIWCANWFQTSARSKETRRSNSIFKMVSDYWKTVSDADKELWKQAAEKVWGQRRGYRLFSMDIIWRHARGFSKPGTPNQFHQLFGLRVSNPGGAKSVIMRIDLKDQTGPFNLKFSYKKNELVPTTDEPFRVNVGAFYFGSGSLKVDVATWESPAGNVAWTTSEKSFGVSGREYYHIIVMFILDYYDAVISLDNIEISDNIGVIESENFITKRYTPFEPDFLVRKEGWGFAPDYAEPYFKYLYLD